MWKKKFRLFLREWMTRTGVTMRSLAETSDMSSGALSEILNGQRTLSDRAALQILSRLNLSEEDRQSWERQIEAETSGTRKLLPKDAEEMITNVYSTPLLCLFEMRDMPKSSQDFESRFPPAARSEIRGALELLKRHGLVEQKPDESWNLLTSYWTTTDNIGSEAGKVAHQNDLRMAANLLETVPTEDRDYLGITFAGNSKRLEAAKRETRKFLNRVAQIMNEGDCDRVFKLNLQLFPVTEAPEEK